MNTRMMFARAVAVAVRKDVFFSRRGAEEFLGKVNRFSACRRGETGDEVFSR